MIVLGIDPGLDTTGICLLVGDHVKYRASIKTPGAWPDERRRKQICADIVEATEKLVGINLAAIWVEGYEYQGPRTHTKNAIRCSLLVGQIVGTLCARGHVVGTVDRTVWGRALGIKTDTHQKVRLHRLTGLKLKNAHERDAACIALYGQRFGDQMEMVG